MKRIAILKEQEAGIGATALCRKHGVSSPTDQARRRFGRRRLHVRLRR